MYAVRVRPSAVRKITTRARVWVAYNDAADYVTEKHRGIWRTREEAAEVAIPPTEIVVEVGEDNQ